MACTSVGGGDGGGATKNIIPPTFSNFGDIINRLSKLINLFIKTISIKCIWVLHNINCKTVDFVFDCIFGLFQISVVDVILRYGG